MMATNNKKALEQEPGDIEALLPWHAAGTLSARDTRRVEDALARDPALAKQYAAIQEEYAETIGLNESLGAPSSRAMAKLFAAIDAEPVRKPSLSLGISTRIAEFFSQLSPRTLATAAALGAVALLLQAGVIGAILSTQQGGSFQTASLSGPKDTAVRGLGQETGARALVRFAKDARMSDVAAFLDANQATIIDSTQGGMFRLQFGDKPMSLQEVAGLMTRLQSEKIIELAVSAR
jgi:anti-sigma-K factor RskA